MKKRKIIIGLVVTMALGIGVTAYAETSENSTTTGREGLGLGRITSMRGQDYVTNVLKNKLNLSQEEITAALNEGKSLHDLAIEKGLTEEALKEALIEEKSNSIDKAVSDGKITSEEAATLKEKIKENINNCTGNYGERQEQIRGEGKGKGCGMMRGGQGSSCQ